MGTLLLYFLVLVSKTRPFEPFDLLSAFLYANKTIGWGKDQVCDHKLEFSSPHRTLGKEWAWNWSSVTKGQWLHQLCLWNETLVKALSSGVPGF